MAAAVEAYCVKCREKREIKDPEEVTMKNGRQAMKGSCPVCGTGLFRILGGGGDSDGEAKPKKAAKPKEPKEPKAKAKKK